MNLETLHREISKTISELDLNSVWPGFAPLPFALFDAEKCFFDGRYVEKTDAFCANTSILYEGRQIATWMAAEELETSVLASKLVHEMFHGYQTTRGWDCWPNEIEALYRSAYSAEHLSVRLRENALLVSLLERFDGGAFRELLSLRRLRSEQFPYEFAYECKTEEIEGTANYIEWQVLKQLDARKADELAQRMCAALTKPASMFPIRISCYSSGALLVAALLAAGIHPFDATERPVLFRVLRDVAPADGAFPGKEASVGAVSQAIAAYDRDSAAIVRSALERNEVVLNGPVELFMLNIYDARRYQDYLTTTCFLMYRDGGEKMIQGNYVVRMRDEKTISAVYRWE